MCRKNAISHELSQIPPKNVIYDPFQIEPKTIILLHIMACNRVCLLNPEYESRNQIEKELQAGVIVHGYPVLCRSRFCSKNR